SGLLKLRGNLRGAIALLQQGLETYRKIGAMRQQYFCSMHLRDIHLSLGNLQEATAYAHQQRETAEALEDQHERVIALLAMGKVFLCQGDGEKAMQAFQ